MKKLRELYYHIAGTPKASEMQMGSSIRNYIKADVYYDKGGWSYLTARECPRGYFISACPIGIGLDSCGTWESHELFSGTGRKQLLFEVKRQSKKKDDDAIVYFEQNIDQFVKDNFPDILVSEGESGVA